MGIFNYGFKMLGKQELKTMPECKHDWFITYTDKQSSSSRGNAMEGRIAAKRVCIAAGCNKQQIIRFSKWEDFDG
ncbi:MAG: hypothetical protein WC917_00590 [Bacilli bacterium]|jgi:hypothetical protein